YENGIPISTTWQNNMPSGPGTEGIIGWGSSGRAGITIETIRVRSPNVHVGVILGKIPDEQRLMAVATDDRGRKTIARVPVGGLQDTGPQPGVRSEERR